MMDEQGWLTRDGECDESIGNYHYYHCGDIEFPDVGDEEELAMIKDKSMARQNAVDMILEHCKENRYTKICDYTLGGEDQILTPKEWEKRARVEWFDNI